MARPDGRRRDRARPGVRRLEVRVGEWATAEEATAAEEAFVSVPRQALRTGGGLSVRVDAAEPAHRNTRS
jgi:hypothetical protein